MICWYTYMLDSSVLKGEGETTFYKSNCSRLIAIEISMPGEL